MKLSRISGRMNELESGVPRLNIGPSALKKITDVEISGNGEVENFGKSPAVIDRIRINLRYVRLLFQMILNMSHKKTWVFSALSGRIGG